MTCVPQIDGCRCRCASSAAVYGRADSGITRGARPALGVAAGAAAGAGAGGAAGAAAGAAGAAGAAAGCAAGAKLEGISAARSAGKPSCCGSGTPRNGAVVPPGAGAGAAAAAGAAAGAAGCGRVTDAVAAGAGVAGAAVAGVAAGCTALSTDVRPCTSCDAAAGFVASCCKNGRPGRLGTLGAGAGTAAGSAAAVALRPSASPAAPAAAIMLVASIFLVNFMVLPIRCFARLRPKLSSYWSYSSDTCGGY